MKHSDMIKAYNTLAQISDNREIPLGVSYKFYTVMEKLEPQYRFQAAQETKLFEKYKPEIQQDGTLKFETQETGKQFADEFQKMLKELDEVEVDFSGFKKPVIKTSEKIGMSVNDIKALRDFIEFSEE